MKIIIKYIHTIILHSDTITMDFSHCHNIDKKFITNVY